MSGGKKKTKQLFRLLNKEDIIFVDTYLADLTLLKKVSKFSKKIIFIDDNDRIPYPAGTILNGNPHAKNLYHIKFKNKKYILGSKYAPIRKEFWSTPKKDINQKVKKILIIFGATDRRNLTVKILNLLKNNYPSIQKNVIIGNGFKNKKEIYKSIDKNTQLYVNPDISLLKKLMLVSDLAISASGQTTLELLRIGIPSIIIAVAANQLQIANYLSKNKLFEYAGEWNDLNIVKKILIKIKKLEKYKLRKIISNKQKKVIDGGGPNRIVNKVLQLLPLKILFLTNNKESLNLAKWLKIIKNEEVKVIKEKITKDMLNKYKPDFLISYNYRYIIPEKVLNMFLPKTAINLHISYLPWNKGSNPNFWSFVKNTPKGVTIHVLDKGIDTGDILLQKEIVFNDNKETLTSTYKKLNIYIQNVFKNNWERIKSLDIKPTKQANTGSIHTMKEFAKIKHILDKEGWDTPVYKLKFIT